MRKWTMEELNRLDIADFKTAPKSNIVLVLDNIRSRNNVGAIFRTADAFRIEEIVLCGITPTPPHKDIHKTALGATESVSWRYAESAAEAVQELCAAGAHGYAVEQVQGATFLDKVEIHPNQKAVLVLGNEVQGVSQEVIDVCNTAVEIPQLGTKHSLNVATSAGVVLWHFFMQLRPKGR
ncbi:MAG: RNA methyltransferase [Flavobacteriaceae bacterium]